MIHTFLAAVFILCPILATHLHIVTYTKSFFLFMQRTSKRTSERACSFTLIECNVHVWSSPVMCSHIAAWQCLRVSCILSYFHLFYFHCFVTNLLYTLWTTHHCVVAFGFQLTKTKTSFLVSISSLLPFSALLLQCFPFPTFTSPDNVKCSQLSEIQHNICHTP